MTSTRKAIVLLRVSTGAQAAADRAGLPAQRRACARIAEVHALEVVETVELAGVSGAEVLADPRFTAMLRRLAEPGIAGVVVADFDRLFRPDRYADFAILDAFADSGSVVFTSEGVIDPADEIGSVIGLFKGKMSGLERRRLAQRTRRGKEERRRLGLRAEGPVGLPRGVTFDAAAKRWAYLWPEAERVRLAFRLVLGGTTNLAEIARRCGWQQPSGTHASWAARSVLTQPLYMGVYRVDRRFKRGRRLGLREESERYETAAPGLDPPLVSRIEFDAVQEILGAARARHAPRRPDAAKDATYAGHLECGLCGSALWAIAPKRAESTFYICSSARARGCPTRSFTAPAGDPQIDAALETRLGEETTLRRLLDEAAAESDRRAAAPAAETTRRLTLIENERERVLYQHEKGAIDDERMLKRVRALDAERKALEAVILTVSEEIEVSSDVVAAVARTFALWGSLARSAKRGVLADLGFTVRVRRGGARRRAIVEVDSVELRALDPSRRAVRLYK